MSSLRRAVAYAKHRYGRHPNVIGISLGHKFVKRLSSDILSVQFFVRRKRRRPISRPLPKFIYARRNGRVDRTTRYPTDVIQIGRIRFSCGAGASVDGLGVRGSATLLFRDKLPSGTRAWYVLTCSHVVGDLTDSPPVHREIALPDCTPTTPFALVEKNTTTRTDMLMYDLAIAALTPEAMRVLQPRLPQLDCRTSSSGTRLSAFIAAHLIRPGLEVDCQSGQSGHLQGRVESYADTFPVNLRGREVNVAHLHAMNTHVIPGDSGGLVYSGDQAVGVLVAQASTSSWSWFQPLEGALAYLNAAEPTTSIKCF